MHRIKIYLRIISRQYGRRNNALYFRIIDRFAYYEPIQFSDGILPEAVAKRL